MPGTVYLDVFDPDVERHAGWTDHRVCPEPRLNVAEDLVLPGWQVAIEQCAQRRVSRRGIRAAAERHTRKRRNRIAMKTAQARSRLLKKHTAAAASAAEGANE